VPDEGRVTLLGLVLDRVGPDQPALRGRLLAQLAGELEVAGAFERRQSTLAELRRLLDTIDDPAERWGLMRGGTVDPGQKWGDRAEMTKVREWCREALADLDDPFERTWAYSLLWSVSATLGDRVGCDDALAALRQERTPVAGYRCSVFDAGGAYLDGRLDDVRRHTQAALEYLHATRHPQATILRWCTRLVLGREQGGISELPLATVRGRTPGGRVIPPAFDSLYGAMRQLLAGEQHLIELDGLERAMDIDGGSRVFAVAWLAEIAAAVGDDPLVEQVLDVVQPRVGMHLLSGCFYWGSYDRLTALLRDRLGDHQRADEAFARAVQAHEALRTPVWVARTQLDWAESLLRRHRRDEAGVHVHAARAAIGDLPLTESRNRADQLEARLI
jgi:hypothetical protein